MPFEQRLYNTLKHAYKNVKITWKPKKSQIIYQNPLMIFKHVSDKQISCIQNEYSIAQRIRNMYTNNVSFHNKDTLNYIGNDEYITSTIPLSYLKMLCYFGDNVTMQIMNNDVDWICNFENYFYCNFEQQSDLYFKLWYQCYKTKHLRILNDDFKFGNVVYPQASKLALEFIKFVNKNKHFELESTRIIDERGINALMLNKQTSWKFICDHNIDIIFDNDNIMQPNYINAETIVLLNELLNQFGIETEFSLEN
jgi:hypothetical protein